MNNIPNLITVSELARLINVSRPTLYKYKEMYENNDTELELKYKELFDYIESCLVKNEIYNYTNNIFKSSDNSLTDKLKFDENKELVSLFNKIIDNKEKINIEELNKYIDEKIKEN
jgi:hypothetical protein